jgi:hypothetical protein
MFFRFPKAVSPLRFATALQNLAANRTVPGKVEIKNNRPQIWKPAGGILVPDWKMRSLVRHIDRVVTLSISATILVRP